MIAKGKYITAFVSIILFSGIGAFSTLGQDQTSNKYFLADRLLQQQDYERAYELFQQLYQQAPNSYIYFEKATECLVHLKKYEKAISLTEKAIDKNRYGQKGPIRLGEIYHIRGDTSRAFQIWDSVYSGNSQNLQVLLSLARTMKDRKAFEKSIGIYQHAANQFPGTSTITVELAQAYMQSGNYENAIEKYLSILEQSPDRINFVQSTLLRFNDEYLYDIAILEIDDFLENLSQDHPSYKNLHDLQLWLLMERNLYERALTTAKQYEESSDRVAYSLYGLGAKLLSKRKFKLAREAFQYYVDKDIYPANISSMEELANVNVEWADYLARYNLGNEAKRDSLYRDAFRIYGKLLNSVPNYRNYSRVLISQSEIALDHLHKPEIARKNLEDLNSIADSSVIAQRNYISGRIKLYEKDYARARIAFTRVNKRERIGTLAQKTRYYLALTDFYSGDYEFAKIQLNALERQNTSYFANDAVQLRVWIQEGLQQDSTGQKLKPFARAIELFSQGEDQKAVNSLISILDSDTIHPLTDEALLELSSNINQEIVSMTYSLISNYLENKGGYSPLKERLMWEKARIADRVVTNSSISPATVKVNADSSIQDLKTMPGTVQGVINLYENVLLEYPQGFYASFARNRIQELEQVQT